MSGSDLSTNPEAVPSAGVVLLAAGQGRRFGAAQPKQFLTLGRRPLMAWSFERLAGLAFVRDVIVVTPPEGLPDGCMEALRAVGAPFRCVAGGARRQDSVAAGLAALECEVEVALVHDSARPFPEPAAVAELARAAARHGGGLLATPATDTIKRAAAGGLVAETLDRREVWLAQTPQAIRADLVARAIAAFRDPARDYTDEASLLESWGTPVALIASPATNFKVTMPEDLARAEAHLRSLAKRD